MRLTIKDIAKKAGVSISTVSRVMNEPENVNEEMKNKVIKVLKETGYRPNALAKSLISRKSNSIGVIIPDLSNLNFAEFVKGIEQCCKALDYSVLIGSTATNPESEISYFNIFSANRVDGIIFCGTILTEKHKQYFKKLDIPLVIYGQNFNGIDIPWINIDNEKASYEATKQLISYGHKDIAFISGPLWDKSAGYDRYGGFLKAIIENGINPSNTVIEEGDFSLKSGYSCMERILNRTKPSAVFASNDFMAMGAIKYLNDNNIRVPEDISVMGFDDISIAEMYNPSLSSININFYDVGKKAVEILMKIINEEETQKENIVSYEIINRKSVKDVHI